MHRCLFVEICFSVGVMITNFCGFFPLLYLFPFARSLSLSFSFSASIPGQHCLGVFSGLARMERNAYADYQNKNIGVLLAGKEKTLEGKHGAMEQRSMGYAWGTG